MRDKQLHVVLGVLGDQKNLSEKLSEALEGAGYINPLIVFKSLRLSVIQYVDENRDVDVLILQEGLESSSFFQVADYAKMLDWNNNLTIIPILTENTIRNKQVLLELYRNNLLTAVFGVVTSQELVRLILHGRTRVEARTYYGITELTDAQDSAADYDSCIQFIISGDNGTLDKRLGYIKKRVSTVDFKIILKRLPKELIEEAMELAEFSHIIKEVFPELLNDNLSRKNKLQQKISSAGNNASSIVMNRGASTLGSPVLVDYMTAVKKVVFGFCGAQQHIGSTFNAIAFAHYLAKNKYKVAVIEDGSQMNPSFNCLKTNAGVISSSETYFRCKNVDYYPEFSLEELSDLLLATDYNFVVIDFGLFRPEILSEFNRCILPVIVSGSKLWEMPFLEQVFEKIDDESTMASYCYLFSFASPAARRSITNNMGKIRNVFFADYLANPLSGEGFPAMEKMVGSYLPIAFTAKEKGESVLDKFKRLFE